MKTLKKLYCSTLAVLLFTGLISPAFSMGADLQKTYTWKYEINKDGNIVFDNYDCNVTIHTWDKAETEYRLMVDANTRTDEDAAVLDTYLQNLKFSNSASTVRFRSSFWENRKSIMGRMTMELEGSKDVSLTDFSIKGELWIPSGCRFELVSKYSEINMEKFSGQLILSLYNDNLYGADVAGTARIDDKYSTIEFKEMKDLTVTLYNSKLEAGNIGNLKIESKYSRVTALSAGILDIESYNDKYSFTKTGDITFIAKYSDLKTESSGNANLDCYEGSVNLKQAKDIKISSKYADFQIAIADNINVVSSYNDKLVAGKLTSLTIAESKYCTYRIDDLKSSVSETDGYQDKFNVVKTGNDFRGLNITGKYVNVSISMLETTDFRFRAKITYAKLEMDESVLKPRIKINDGNRLEYDAVKGTDKEGMPLIEVNGYQMSLKIVEL